MAAEPPAKLDYKSRRLVSQIVEHVKSQGIFDQFRRDCIDELEQKESYRQLKQRVESHVATFLSKQTWTDALPKNQVRDSLRKHINQSEVLDRGVKQLISQALDSKAKVFQTRIEGVVQNYIYTQKHPQNQDKQTRKRKTVEDKEETKPTSSEVICDISQLIPIPCSSGSKTESHGAEKGKSGLQESSKSVTVKGGQPVKKSYPTQGKSSILAGKADETKTGSPAREKDQAEESSRIKDGKTRISRVKVESLSRDDNSQLLPAKSEESVPKVKDEKTKISRIKLENYNPSENYRSPADSGNLNSQDEKISSLKGIRETLVPKQLCPTDEAGFSQGYVTGLLQVKVEKTNKDESDSYDFATSENKIKVKEERSEAFGVKTEVESGETKILQEQEKFVDDSEKGLEKNLFDDGHRLSKADAEIQRSDSFVKTEMVEEMGERVVAKDDVQDTPVVVDENIAKELEGIERLESLKQTETVGKLEKKSGNKREEKRDSGTESCVKKRNAMAADVSRVKTIDFKAAKSDDELSAGEKIIGATELSSVIDKSQTMSDERSPLSWQKDDVSKTEPVHEKMGSENPSMVAESVGHASSTGEYSDGESDISEVSSVHTSDLSSFDEEISSSSESIYDQEEEACEAETNEETEKDQELSSAQPQSEQDSHAAPMRRSTRISSRRSTKEGESEISGNEGSKIQTGSPRKRRHGEKRERKPRPERDIKERSEFDAEKRKRGRPRKEERQASNQSSTQMRRSRTRDRDGSRTAAERSSSGSRGDRRKRSQRQIKRTRCYSPSSEGTREVFLPRKRSRDGPN